MSFIPFRIGGMFKGLEGMHHIWYDHPITLYGIIVLSVYKVTGYFLFWDIDFPESFFALPRPGDERSYMRPLVDSTEMMQPSLDMLNPTLDNPTLDEFLDRLEPMESMNEQID